MLIDPAVSYGVGVHPEVAYLARATAAGVATVRRSTGGTGLLHSPGDLAWSVVLPRSDPRVGHDYVRAYARLGEGVVHFLSERGARAKWVAPPAIDPNYCLLSARGSVLVHGEKVLGGAAQHLTGTALLHSGIVPFELDRPLLEKIFALSPKAVSRLTSLREVGVDGSPEELAWKLAANLANALSGK